MDQAHQDTLQKVKSILDPETTIEEQELREVCKLERLRVDLATDQIEEAIRQQRLQDEEAEAEEEDAAQGQSSTQAGEELSDRSAGNALEVTRAPNTSGEIELTQIQDEEVRGLMNRAKTTTK